MNNKNVIIIVAFISLTFIYILGRNYVASGSLLNSCRYTEKLLTVPQELRDGSIQSIQTSFVVFGENKEYKCLPTVSAINSEIIGPGMIDSSTKGKDYYENQGRKVFPFSLDKKLHVTKVLEVTKKGTGVVDYLIMDDEQGVSYKIATTELGFGHKDLFFQFTSSGRSQVLESSNFRADTNQPFDFLVKP